MKTIQLTDCESRLLDELLDQERRELQPEVHHTDTAAMRETLQKRFQTVNRLIERLNETESVHGCGCKSS